MSKIFSLMEGATAFAEFLVISLICGWWHPQIIKYPDLQYQGITRTSIILKSKQ